MFRPTLTLTANTIKPTYEAGLTAIGAGQTEIDLANVSAVDSAAVAALVGWQRAARRQGRPLTFLNVPANLASLIALYGVAELLPVAHARRADLPHH